ncbi:hypothetical protein [Palleronia sediminis]|uniref:hypothetical protein n=1 Tax=Palleronia sediminis TaxID=2547833 RepID=UPI001455BCFD|nr:hypothetical protein [Palleronia sediminis]
MRSATILALMLGASLLAGCVATPVSGVNTVRATAPPVDPNDPCNGVPPQICPR